MDKNKKISIKEIAKVCNVSVATVSRVINDNGRFSEETRKKVEGVIAQFDYTPNMVARSLRTNKSQSIGVLVPNINNEFFSSIVLEIESYFFPKGYSVFICNTNGDEEREKEYLRSLDVKGVDGLIYISGMKDIPTDCLKRKIPMVCIDRNPNINQNIVIVQSDNYNGGFLATEELIKKGCKDILILKSFKSHSSNKQRFEGYSAALKKYNLPLQEELILDINTTLEASRQVVGQLIKKHIKFDGIFAVNDLTALGALISLKENKIKVPKQVKIVGFDNVFISQYSNPAITTINQDKKQLAQEASKVLLDLINNEFLGEHHIVLPISLIVRGTT